MNNMFNPYMNYPQGYPQFPQQEKQQPITQNFQLASPMNNNDNHFMAQFVKENEIVENIPVIYKTAFIDLKNANLKIKETNGDIATYEIILPKDEKDKKIELLEKEKYDRDLQINTMQNEINQLKELIENADTTNVKSSTKITKSNANDK